MTDDHPRPRAEGAAKPRSRGASARFSKSRACALSLVAAMLLASTPRALALLAPSQPPPTASDPAILQAHAIVVRRSPEQGSVAAGNIGKVEVWYDAGIRDAFAALAVIGATGERVDKHDAAIDKTDPTHVTVSVDPLLIPGKYTVRFRALSADGHLVSGAWEFEVKP